MGAGKYLAIIAGIITILGTYVLALYGVTPLVGSGIGFITNLFGGYFNLFGNAELLAAATGTNIVVYYIVLILFIIWLASGVLQLIGVKSRAVVFIFSLFPLGIGIMFMLLLYTDILGNLSALFTYAMLGQQIGEIFPFLVPLGDVGLGVYFLIAGGVIGIISGILPREEYY